MRELVAFDVDGDVSVVVEVNDDGGADYVRAASPGEIVGKASENLQKALAVVRPTVEALAENLKDISGPDVIEVEFGLALTGKAGAVLTSVEGEAHIQVTLTWDRRST